MDYVSLQHVVGLTAHDRTSKLIYHPHRTAKVPTFSTRVQVGPLYTSCYFNHVILCDIQISSCTFQAFFCFVLEYLYICVYDTISFL